MMNKNINEDRGSQTNRQARGRVRSERQTDWQTETKKEKAKKEIFLFS